MKPFTTITALTVFGIATSNAEEIEYSRDIAPVLRAYCAGCHNDVDLEGDLSVETYTQLAEGASKKTIRPGEPDESYLIKVIEGRSKPKMPPEDEPAPTEKEVELLRKWITQGAKSPENDTSLLANLVVPKVEASENPKPITAMAISHDGSTKAVARYGMIEISGNLGRAISGLPGKVTSLAFSPDGKKLAAGSGITGLSGVATIIDLGVPDKAPLSVAAGSDMLYAAVFSPDGATLATAGYDRAIRLWKVDDGSLIRQINGHKGAVFDLAFHPGGQAIASASADGTAKLWRVSDGLRLDTLTGTAAEQFSVAFSPDGTRLLGAGADNRIRMWKMLEFDAPRIQPLLHTRFAHEGAIERIAITPDGKHIISTADDFTLKSWKLANIELAQAFDRLPDTVSAITTSKDAGGFEVALMNGETKSFQLEPGGTAPKLGSEHSNSPAVLPEATDLAGGSEKEPNNAPESAAMIAVPSEIKGAINSPGDVDLFRFNSAAGERVILEINAARSKSKLDSKLEILHADGRPVEQVVLQAVRDSWFTFRGKDSSTSDDFRLQNWREMELNEFLYANGEVVKLWHYPRGPDSGFKVYPGFGNRRTYFHTTALSHALGEPSYIVRALPPGSNPTPNGLPVFRLPYQNDDDSLRRLGSDSRLIFTAPADGEFLVRVSDVRGFGGGENYHYTLKSSRPAPGFSIKLDGKNPKLAPATGKLLTFTATRNDDFEGPIQIDISGLPEGYVAPSPIVIGEGQTRAFGSIFAMVDAPALNKEQAAAVQIKASALVAGEKVTQNLGDLGTIDLGGEAKLLVSAEPLNGASEITVRPGETTYALARAERRDFKARIEFGKDDSGKSLPHGLYVDNIGLNGLMIVEGQTQREFAITATDWVEPGEHWFFLTTGADGGRTSLPIRVRVLGDQE